jgi:uncharacterized protein YchJ
MSIEDLLASGKAKKINDKIYIQLNGEWWPMEDVEVMLTKTEPVRLANIKVIEGKTVTQPLRDNPKCSCGSGKKTKRCCQKK